MSDDVQWMDATAQADLVASGQVTALEMIDLAINRISEIDTQINAVPIRDFEKARRRASTPAGGPFAGVPFLYKNLGASELGDPVTLGMKGLAEADFRSARDDYLAIRFREAGLVSLGKTNIPEMGIKAVTEPDHYGVTHNPWKHGYSVGGSSGGSAAAVACGMVPVAHATDGGGSIRIPASECGVVGLKPSRGRVSAGPANSTVWNGLAHEFAVTRSVRDTARLLDWVQGYMPGDPWSAPTPRQPYVSEVGVNPGHLRIGYMDRTPAGWPDLHVDCITAVQESAKLLEELGHHVELTHPSVLDEIDYRPQVLTTIAVHTANLIDELGELLGRPLGPNDMETWTWALSEHGRTRPLSEYLKVEKVFNTYTRSLGQWWAQEDPAQSYDLLLSPTLLTPPPAHGSMNTPTQDPMKAFDLLHDFLPFTPIANVTGQPAISLPLFWNSDGLPVGVQLMAAYGREDVLIRLASQLESARPWAEHHPLLSRS